MNQTDKRPPVLSLLLYIVAVMLVVYTIWAFVCCHTYIAKLIASNQLAASGNEFSIVSYYMTNCIQYILYAVTFFFFGKLYSYIVRNAPVKPKEPPEDENQEMPTILNADSENEIDDFNNFPSWKSSR